MIKLSIIIINYNNTFGLEETLKSIAGQTFTDYGQIIIDGGSTDNSVSIIKQFENSTKQAFAWIISEKDSVVIKAQNKVTL